MNDPVTWMVQSEMNTTFGSEKWIVIYVVLSKILIFCTVQFITTGIYRGG